MAKGKLCCYFKGNKLNKERTSPRVTGWMCLVEPYTIWQYLVFACDSKYVQP